MRALLFVLASSLLASSAFAADGEVGTMGAGDPFEVGLVAGPWTQQGSPDPKAPLSAASATLLGVRVRGAAYTHQTILGNGGGVEGILSAGYAVPGVPGVSEGFAWAQLDALANVGLFNRGLGRFAVRLHALVGLGASLFSGLSLIGGGRLALAITEIFSLEGNYMVLPSTSLTFSHRVTGALKIEPIQLALGADLNFGSNGVGEQHFSVIGTATWRPKFD
jgi:hypothetical protein